MIDFHQRARDERRPDLLQRQGENSSGKLPGRRGSPRRDLTVERNLLQNERPCSPTRQGLRHGHVRSAEALHPRSDGAVCEDGGR